VELAAIYLVQTATCVLPFIVLYQIYMTVRLFGVNVMEIVKTCVYLCLYIVYIVYNVYIVYIAQ
jgi:hypothetical protein